jgi:hypothetical protein
LGDIEYKHPHRLVVAQPDVTRVDLTPDDRWHALGASNRLSTAAK